MVRIVYDSNYLNVTLVVLVFFQCSIDQKVLKLVKCLKHFFHMSYCVLCISKYMCSLLRTLSSLHLMSPILIILALEQLYHMT